MTAATAGAGPCFLSWRRPMTRRRHDMQKHEDVLARLQQARKSYGAVRALDGVDLTLRAGELATLLGPNGAGKTTAIGLLLGLVRPDAGEVALFGRDPQQLAARRHI